MSSLRLYLVVMVVLTPFLSGCGKKVGQVHGKILFNGKPVPVGTISFSPVGEGFEVGRPAVGAPDSEGKFQLSTFKRHDGALVGTHRVVYGPPQAPEGNEELRKTPKFIEEYQNYLKYRKCRLPEGHTFEVKPGLNEVTLELTETE